MIISMRPVDYVVLITVSMALSACGVFGASYVVGEGYPALQLWAECLLTVLFTLLVMILLTFLAAAFDWALDRSLQNAALQSRAMPHSRLRRIFERLTPRWELRSIVTFSAIMALLWLPWYIANFPGGTYWDTYYQIYQVYPENHPIAIIPWAEIYDQTLTDAWLVDHHPVFTTLVYGAFGWVSDQLSGSWMAGVAIFCALQGAAHVAAFTASVAYLRKVGSPPVLNFVAYAFFALMPFISTWAMCMVKDSFFGLVLVGYFMMLFECVRTRGALFLSRRNVILFVLAGLGLCLTKKTGLFVVVVTAVVALIACWWRRRRNVGAPAVAPRAAATATSATAAPAPAPAVASKVAVAAASTTAAPAPTPVASALSAAKAFAAQALTCLIVMCLVFPFALFPALDIVPGGRQEALGPMLQQTARYVCDYGSEVTPQEREAISRVVDYSRLDDQYRFDFEDSVKYRYNLDATGEDLLAYFKVYLQQGVKHPDAYFAAIVSLAGFYVAPTAPINIRMVTVDTKMGDDQRYMLWNPDGVLEDLRTGLDDAYQRVSETPVLNAPFLIVVYVLWIPAFLLYMLWRHRRPEAVLPAGVMLAPFAVLLAFCVIAPVYDARYVVPVLDAVPLLFCAVFTCIMNSFQDDAESRLERGGSAISASPSVGAGCMCGVTDEGRGPDGKRRCRQRASFSERGVFG